MYTHDEEKVSITCALPLYRSGKIAWLALESLCRQKNIDFDWELIVCEELIHQGMTFEPGEVLYHEGLMEYESRLKEVRCKRIKYIGLNEWIPLSDKWVEIAKSSNSDYFLLVAADCYSQPYRLKESFDLFEGGVDWMQSPVGVFYNISNQSMAMFDASLSNHPCSLNMGMRTELVRLFPPKAGIRKSVDSWLFNRTKSECLKMHGRYIKVGTNKSENWKYGLDSHGYNQISKGRGKMIGGEGLIPVRPFRLPKEGEPSSISEILPDDIVSRLGGLPPITQTESIGPASQSSRRLSRISNKLSSI